MKLIIAGGRDYWLTHEDFAQLDAIHAESPVSEEVCGMALGADACGYAWAAMRGIPVVKFPAEWDRLGRRAGPTRNAAMALYANAVALFPGGSGTQNMHDAASRHGLKIYDFRT